MKDEAGFVKYLGSNKSRRTGKALSPRSIRDVVSRCERVEHLLGLDLSSAILSSEGGADAVAEKIRDNAGKLGFVGKKPYYYNDFVSAVRRYQAFLTREKGERQWSLVPKSMRRDTRRGVKG